GNRLVVNGQLASTTSGELISISLGFCDVFGQVMVGSGAQIATTALLNLATDGALVGAPTGTYSSSKDITGNTTSSARTRQGGTYSLTGGSGALPPQLLEVMGEDRGAVTNGYLDNFARGRLS